MAQHFLNKYKMIGVKLHSKFDLRRLCRAIKATALPRLVPPSPSETGHCDEVKLEEVWTLLFIFNVDLMIMSDW